MRGLCLRDWGPPTSDHTSGPTIIFYRKIWIFRPLFFRPRQSSSSHPNESHSSSIHACAWASVKLNSTCLHAFFFYSSAPNLLLSLHLLYLWLTLLAFESFGGPKVCVGHGILDCSSSNIHFIFYVCGLLYLDLSLD